MVELLLLGSIAGSGAGLLAGLIGIGGGIVVVPVVFYGLTASGVPANAAAHIAVGTSLAAILPASTRSQAAKAGAQFRAFRRRVTMKPVDSNRWQIELDGAPTELVVTCRRCFCASAPRSGSSRCW